jgi:electron transfer flavoprotein beta subunit
MRLAVCVKQVVQRDSPVRVNQAGTWTDDTRAIWELNEPDAYALEAALVLREQYGGEVTVVSAGPARVLDVLREALARGADRGVHVAGDHLAMADARTTAAALALAFADDPTDLILTGLQSSDLGAGQVGVILAERLGRPHATIVMALEADGEGFRVKRELEAGWSEWVRLPKPALVTIQSGINQLRYATLRGIMAAKKKPVRIVAAPDPGPTGQRLVRLVTPGRTKQTTLFEGPVSESARDLVRALRDEARAL